MGVGSPLSCSMSQDWTLLLVCPVAPAGLEATLRAAGTLEMRGNLPAKRVSGDAAPPARLAAAVATGAITPSPAPDSQMQFGNWISVELSDAPFGVH